MAGFLIFHLFLTAYGTDDQEAGPIDASGVVLHANGTDPPDLIVISDGADGKMGDSYTRELGEGGYIDPVVLRGGSDTKKFELNSKDNYAPYLVLDPLEHDLPEGDSVKFGVSLSEAPTGNVTVTFALDEVPGFGDVVNSDIVFKPSSLTFTTTNWGVPQKFQVKHKGNSVPETTGQIYVDVIPNGGGVAYDSQYDYVTLNFEDDDTPILVLDPNTIDPFAEGSSATFDVDLDKVPSGNVTVALTLVEYSDPGDGNVTDASLSISPSSLTFTTTNWNDTQEVTVTHTENSDIETSGWIFVNVKPSGGGVEYDAIRDNVALDFEDNDTPILVLDPNTIDPFSEGSSATFDVDLDKVPTGNVTVALTLDEYTGEGDVTDASLSISPSTLTFTTTNWSDPQEVTVTHTDNSTIETSGWIYVDVNPSGGGVTYDASEDFVSLNFQDNDMPTVALTASPNPVEEGDVTVPVTITAVSAETGDYTTPNPSSITITSGQTSGTLAIQTNQDVDDE